MNQKLLRVMIILPNVLSYIILIGLVFIISSNFEGMKNSNMFMIWLMITVVIGIGSIVTSISIAKKIKKGIL